MKERYKYLFRLFQFVSISIALTFLVDRYEIFTTTKNDDNILVVVSGNESHSSFARDNGGPQSIVEKREQRERPPPQHLEGAYFEVLDNITNQNSGGAPNMQNMLSLTPDRIRIRLFGKKVPKTALRLYSVTVVSEGRYTGTAELIHYDEGQSLYVYDWFPSFPGNYNILVHEITQRGNPHSSMRRSALTKQSPLPITITSTESSSAAADNADNDLSMRIKETQKVLPPCQTLTEIDAFAEWDGDWVGPQLKPDNALRSGWAFLPSFKKKNCVLETFDQTDLLSIPEKKSIHFLGSSRERGIFLSLVDLLLSADEKEHFHSSVVAKCWGRAVITKGNLTISYQDFRANLFKASSQEFSVCHGDSMVAEDVGILLKNATKVFQEMFDDEKSWPSAVHLLTPFEFVEEGRGRRVQSSHFILKDHVQSFISMLPRTWKGTMFLGDYEFSARKAGLVDTTTYQSYLERLKEFTGNITDKRVRWIDGIGISKEMRMYSQSGEERITKSQHFHKFCHHKNETTTKEEKESGIKVCSNITDMVAQLMLGHVLGPKAEFIQTVKKNKKQWNDDEASILTYCHACPRDLKPFHITPYPNMTCAVGKMHDRTESEVQDYIAEQPKECPEHCLKKPPFKQLHTESDVVDVRHCALRQP